MPRQLAGAGPPGGHPVRGLRQLRLASWSSAVRRTRSRASQVIGSTSAARDVLGVRLPEDSIALAAVRSDNVDLRRRLGRRPTRTQDAAAANGGPGGARGHDQAATAVHRAHGRHQRPARDRGLRRVLPRDVVDHRRRIAAADELARRPSYQFCGNETSSRTGSHILLMSGEFAFSFAVGTGWRTIGPSGIVTRADYGQIHEIDGKPAGRVGQAATWTILGRQTFGNPLAVTGAGTRLVSARDAAQGRRRERFDVPGAVPEGVDGPDDDGQPGRNRAGQRRTRFAAPAAAFPPARTPRPPCCSRARRASSCWVRRTSRRSPRHAPCCRTTCRS